MTAPDAPQTDRLPEEKPASRWPPHSVLIVGAFVFMAVALAYVWCHIHMTTLEYRVAEAFNQKEKLLEEQRRLKLELATLKAPRRIEAIARDRLRMTAPALEQVVMLKTGEGTP